MVFDPAALSARLMGDRALAAEVLATFLADLPRQVAGLRDRLDADDFATAARLSHSVKGAAAQVGAACLCARAAALEQACQAGGGAGARAALDALNTAVAEFERTVQDV